MNQVTLLRDALRPHLAWHGARLSFVATFLIALFRVINPAIIESAFFKLEPLKTLDLLLQLTLPG